MNFERALAFTALAVFVVAATDSGEPPPFEVIQGDALVHVASQFLFPPQIGELRRVLTKQYDQAGRDISVDYNGDRPQIAAAIYVYPVHGKTLQEEFRFRQNEVVSQHPNAKVVTSGPTSVSPAKIAGLMTDYAYMDKFRGRVQKLRSRLVVAEQGDWSVEYRLTYPESGGKNAATRVDSLLASFSFPAPSKNPAQTQ
jgi:hypothetical protein